MGQPVVEVDGLTFTYAGSAAPALTDLNLTVDAGEFVTITGPSGCGKSTLAFCLTGFIPHSFDGVMEGKVIIGGRDTRSCLPGELAGIAGLVQQDPESQLCTLKVADEAAFGPENLCLPPVEIRRRVDWALSAVGVSGLTDRAVHTLSGGEKQRLAIASVLAMRPQLLILDEPTANLDPRGCREVLAVIDKLRREQSAAIIVIEHRLQYLLPLSDRLVVIENGRITEDQQPPRLDLIDKPPVLKIDAGGWESGAGGTQQEPSPVHPQSSWTPGVYQSEAGSARQKPSPALPQRTFSSSDGAAGSGQASAPDSKKPLLSLEGITVKYEEKTALSEISFSLYPGETAALMGDNGCGKTTLLLVLLGILKPEQGRIYLEGEEITGLGVTQRAREMGLTFQNPNHQLFERTVLKEARLPSQFLSRDLEQSLERVEELLPRFDLSSYREQVPFALSLGEKKRLTLISVLAYEPRILLLDEPLVGQDQQRLELLLDALSEHRRRGGLTIMACHEPQVVERCCERVLFLEQGNLILDAPTEEAFQELACRGMEEYLPQSVFSANTGKGAVLE